MQISENIESFKFLELIKQQKAVAIYLLSMFNYKDLCSMRLVSKLIKELIDKPEIQGKSLQVISKNSYLHFLQINRLCNKNDPLAVALQSIENSFYEQMQKDKDLTLKIVRCLEIVLPSSDNLKKHSGRIYLNYTTEDLTNKFKLRWQHDCKMSIDDIPDSVELILNFYQSCKREQNCQKYEELKLIFARVKNNAHCQNRNKRTNSLYFLSNQERHIIDFNELSSISDASSPLYKWLKNSRWVDLVGNSAPVQALLLMGCTFSGGFILSGVLLKDKELLTTGFILLAILLGIAAPPLVVGCIEKNKEDGNKEETRRLLGPG